MSIHSPKLTNTLHRVNISNHAALGSPHHKKTTINHKISICNYIIVQWLKPCHYRPILIDARHLISNYMISSNPVIVIASSSQCPCQVLCQDVISTPPLSVICHRIKRGAYSSPQKSKPIFIIKIKTYITKTILITNEGYCILRPKGHPLRCFIP